MNNPAEVVHAGVSKLPRQRPDQMSAVEQAPTADNEALGLAPRKFRTIFGDLFLFASDLARMDLGEEAANLPGSGMIPAAACTLARQSHGGDHVRGQGPPFRRHQSRPWALGG